MGGPVADFPFESERLYNNGGSITENLGGTDHRSCVVADTDNGIRT
jgi:hypothetical protein